MRKKPAPAKSALHRWLATKVQNRFYPAAFSSIILLSGPLVLERARFRMSMRRTETNMMTRLTLANRLHGLSAKRRAALVTLSLLATFALPAHALSAADNQEIQRFTLSESFLQRYAAAAADARQQVQRQAPDSSDDADADAPPDAGPDSDASPDVMASLDSMTAEITRSPAKLATLQRHGLGAREAAVGGLVLMRARLADESTADPKMAKYVGAGKTPSAANMAFYRAHKATIAKIMIDDN